MINIRRLIAFAISLLIFMAPFAKADSVGLLVMTAVERDRFLQKMVHLQKAATANSIAVGQLPDPKLRVNYANLPVDTLDTNQEPFTQFQVGVSQRFVGGKTRSLKSEQQELKIRQYDVLSQNRRAEIRREVTKLWVKLLANHYSLELAKRDRVVFEQLFDSVQSSYVSGIGDVNQRELLNAELELARFDDRIVAIEAKKNTILALFSEYLPAVFVKKRLDSTPMPVSLTALDTSYREGHIQTKLQWPRINNQFQTALTLTKRELTQAVKRHPAVVSLLQGYQMDAKEIDIQKQKYRPNWTLSAQLGYRENDPVGNSRADFISVGVEFDLPVFTKKRQAQSVIYAHQNALATQLDIDQFVLTAIAQFNAIASQYQKILQRENIYATRLVPQLREISASVESAYASGESTLIVALNAKVDELNAQIELNEIVQTKYALMADLHYLTTQISE